MHLIVLGTFSRVQVLSVKVFDASATRVQVLSVKVFDASATRIQVSHQHRFSFFRHITPPLRKGTRLPGLE
ncbi:Uncharacterised protein [Klebsiella pneumoniae]|nr:Uncharacterised protein [Klebsiella pneumoniae]